MICQTWTIGKAIRALFADRVTYIDTSTRCIVATLQEAKGLQATGAYTPVQACTVIN